MGTKVRKGGAPPPVRAGTPMQLRAMPHTGQSGGFSQRGEKEALLGAETWEKVAETPGQTGGEVRI